jgi:hypothetical protein
MRRRRPGKPLIHSTSNHVCLTQRKAARQFVRWLARDRRLLDNPLRGLNPMNARADLHHDRRAVAPDEFA